MCVFIAICRTITIRKREKAITIYLHKWTQAHTNMLILMYYLLMLHIFAAQCVNKWLFAENLRFKIVVKKYTYNFKDSDLMVINIPTATLFPKNYNLKMKRKNKNI